MFGNFVAMSLLQVAFSAPGGLLGQAASLDPPATAYLTPSATAELHYRLPAAASKVGFTIVGAKIGTVRKLVGAADAGDHVAAWDLRYGGASGPVVPPGNYVVTLTVDGRSFARSLKVVRDPKGTANDADLLARYRLLVQIYDQVAILEPEIAEGEKFLKLPHNPPGNSFSTAWTRMDSVLNQKDPDGLREELRTLSELAKRVQAEPHAPNQKDTDDFASIMQSVKMFNGLYREIIH